ncbi:MAG: DNA-3-methyladenine glycosylase 2 family protein [Planctomycetota bacterium]
MWFDQSAPEHRWADAAKFLSKTPKMRAIIREVGPCTLEPKRDTFVLLIKSILSQQVSTAAAAAMFKKFAARFPRKKPTPTLVHDALTGGWTDDEIRACGISRQKRGYLTDLAARYADGSVEPRKLRRMDDAGVVENLTQIKGIGVWTVEMLLIFGFNRPNVWPVGDLGLRNALAQLHDLDERPAIRDCEPMGEPFAPYRSIATWYLWRSLGE